MKKIVIAGKGASGKNFLMGCFNNRGFRNLVSHTTRKMRPGEKDGVDYHFITVEEFKKMVSNNEFVEFQEFNGNYYGASVKEWNESDIVILARQGIDKIKQLGMRDECFIIYLDIPKETRMERLGQRKNSTSSEIEKRIDTDDKEFSGFNDYDLIITNPNF